MYFCFKALRNVFFRNVDVPAAAPAVVVKETSKVDKIQPSNKLNASIIPSNNESETKLTSKNSNYKNHIHANANDSDQKISSHTETTITEKVLVHSNEIPPAAATNIEHRTAKSTNNILAKNQPQEQILDHHSNVSENLAKFPEKNNQPQVINIYNIGGEDIQRPSILKVS